MTARNVQIKARVFDAWNLFVASAANSFALREYLAYLYDIIDRRDASKCIEKITDDISKMWNKSIAV